MNFMTAFPLIISSFCTPLRTLRIQSTADSKRGIDSFSLNSTEQRPRHCAELNVRPVMKALYIYTYIYIYLYLLDRVTRREWPDCLSFQSSNYYHRSIVNGARHDDWERYEREKERERGKSEEASCISWHFIISY